MSESREQVAALAEELANDIVRTVLVNRRVDEECAVGFARDVLRPRLARALAACALEEASKSKVALLAARKFVRGRHSTLTYGPRVLLEQLDLALNRIAELERAAEGTTNG